MRVGAFAGCPPCRPEAPVGLAGADHDGLFLVLDARSGGSEPSLAVIARENWSIMTGLHGGAALSNHYTFSANGRSFSSTRLALVPDFCRKAAHSNETRFN